MNEQGDMLRVATNVVNQQNERAVGTYIPRTNPDGQPNPVVSTLLRGETYRGQAFVVDAWYVAVYEPLRDAGGRVQGAVFAGIKQEYVPSLRAAILSTKVGKTGYVFILKGTGDSKGTYLFSKDGKRDGESIWDARDAEGHLFIQSLIGKALPLKAGEVATERYPWQNQGETKARWKTTIVSYYQPWDWVIGVGAYDDDVDSILDDINSTRSTMLKYLAGIGLFASVIGALVFFRFALGISRRVGALATVASAVASGSVDNADHILAEAFGHS
jgi:hypothetical protein